MAAQKPTAATGAAAAAAAGTGQAQTPREALRAATVAMLTERCGEWMSDAQVLDAEAGVFNWALACGDERRVACNWANPRFRALYTSKARSVTCNMDPRGYVTNDRLLQRLREREFLPHDVASMNPENVHPERWRNVVEMKMRRDEYISNAKPMAMTDHFCCARCKKRECSYMELQMRSCDEPASLFIQCLSCGHRWRLG
jgi:DNA-directed RNA polymerase subunit M/transcription elongation factor TFIIS